MMKRLIALLFLFATSRASALSCCEGYTGAPAGCEDTDCQNRVADGDPYCASSSWDFQCSQEARGIYTTLVTVDPPCDCASSDPTPTPTLPPQTDVCDVIALAAVRVPPAQLVDAHGSEDAVVIPHTLAASRTAQFLLSFDHQTCKEGDRKNQNCVVDTDCPPYNYDGICDRALATPPGVSFILADDDTHRTIYEYAVAPGNPFVSLALPIMLPSAAVDDRSHLRLGLTWYSGCATATRDVLFTARRPLAPQTPLPTLTPTDTPEDTPVPTDTPEP
jgi:hypothetical protein